MRFALLNRVGTKSYYKRALHEVLKTKGDTLLLGYGYLNDELFNKDHNLLNSIDEGFRGINEYKQIILVGSYHLDYNEFKNAAEKIHNHNPSIEIKLIIKKLNHYNSRKYHKKIAIKYNRAKNNKGNNPIIALLGSSNFTSSAYDDGLDKNQELDVLIWNPFVINEQNEKLILEKIELNEDYIEKIHKKSSFENNKLYDLLKNNPCNIDLGLTFQLDEIINEINNYEYNNFFLDLCLVDFSHIKFKDFFEVNTSYLNSINEIIINQYKNKIQQNSKELSSHVSMLYDYFLNYLDIVKHDRALHDHKIAINKSLKFLENKSWNDYIKVIQTEQANEATKKLISCLKTKKIGGTTLYQYLCES